MYCHFDRCNSCGSIPDAEANELTGDAMAHAILPGAAIFLIAGLSLGAMTLGGLLAGMVVALLSGLVTRATILREDASLAAYLISLAVGALIVSTRGSNVDLMHAWHRSGAGRRS